MKRVILTIALVVASSTALAQTNLKTYSCDALDSVSRHVSLGATDKSDAEAKAKALLNTQTVSCSVAPRAGGLSDLGGKKWGFQGLTSNETYLVFQNGEVLHIQKCGSGKRIQKFSAEVVGVNTLKLSEAGTEGQCNPSWVAGFKTGSVVTIHVLISEDQPSTLLLSDKRPNEDMTYTTLYKEMKN